jgi:hypothetical protein
MVNHGKLLNACTDTIIIFYDYITIGGIINLKYFVTFSMGFSLKAIKLYQPHHISLYSIIFDIQVYDIVIA